MTVYTIGHSTHSAKKIIELLQAHDVTAIADIRSSPYSRFNADFNRESLRKNVQENGIAYVFLGHQLGARSKDPDCYDNGRVLFARLARTELFQAGLQRVLDGAKSYRLALLCAEQEPLECHRAILVSRELEARGVSVEHIHRDGSIETHQAAMLRLLVQLGLFGPSLYWTKDEQIAEAYSRQEQRIAYANYANYEAGPGLREEA